MARERLVDWKRRLSDQRGVELLGKRARAAADELGAVPARMERVPDSRVRTREAVLQFAAGLSRLGESRREQVVERPGRRCLRFVLRRDESGSAACRGRTPPRAPAPPRLRPTGRSARRGSGRCRRMSRRSSIAASAARGAQPPPAAGTAPGFRVRHSLSVVACPPASTSVSAFEKTLTGRPSWPFGRTWQTCPDEHPKKRTN